MVVPLWCCKFCSDSLSVYFDLLSSCKVIQQHCTMSSGQHPYFNRIWKKLHSLSPKITHVLYSLFVHALGVNPISCTSRFKFSISKCIAKAVNFVKFAKQNTNKNDMYMHFCPQAINLYMKLENKH